MQQFNSFTLSISQMTCLLSEKIIIERLLLRFHVQIKLHSLRTSLSVKTVVTKISNYAEDISDFDCSCALQK